MKPASPGLLEMPVVRVNAGGGRPPGPPPSPPLFLQEKFVLATTAGLTFFPTFVASGTKNAVCRVYQDLS
jgi:hypothetical protein